MFRITVHYNHPDDPDEFLDHYRGTHAVLAAKLPGLRAYGWGPTTTFDGSEPEHFLVAVMEWDSRDECAAAFASPAGQVAQADMANFAAAGADVNFHEVVAIEPTGA